MVPLTPDETRWFADEAGRLSANLQKALVGRPAVLELVLVALFSEGHILMEDVPGTGKTTLARALAQSVDGTWRRIQFTPDLLPSDVTGAQVYNQATTEFEFRPGAIFANIVLADEINRASPKTQSALLEMMEERQHTVDGQQYLMPRPSVVIATQNPVELEGTYRLPEAQLDRFLIRSEIGYPAFESEIDILATASREPRPVSPCTSVERLDHMITMADRVHAERALVGYVATLATATRSHPQVELGASTRGAIALLRAAKTLAAIRGHAQATPDHVQELTAPVLGHRLILTPDADLNGVEPDAVLAEIVAREPVPIERVG